MANITIGRDFKDCQKVLSGEEQTNRNNSELLSLQDNNIQENGVEHVDALEMFGSHFKGGLLESVSNCNTGKEVTPESH